MFHLPSGKMVEQYEFIGYRKTCPSCKTNYTFFYNAGEWWCTQCSTSFTDLTNFLCLRCNRVWIVSGGTLQYCSECNSTRLQYIGPPRYGIELDLPRLQPIKSESTQDLIIRLAKKGDRTGL